MRVCIIQIINIEARKILPDRLAEFILDPDKTNTKRYDNGEKSGDKTLLKYIILSNKVFKGKLLHDKACKIPDPPLQWIFG